MPVESAEWLPDDPMRDYAAIKAVINGTEWTIPDDMSLGLRREVEEWVEAGNRIAPAAETKS
jgi:hypothetical protein